MALEAHQAVIASLHPLIPDITRLAREMRACLARGGKVVWLGNGGSAADSQHLAAEMVGRYRRERKGLAALALTTDTSILTSVGNDYGYEHIFARQVEALCTAADVVVGISTSGNSRNVLLAIAKAREIGAYTVGLLGGRGGQLKETCDLALVVGSDDTARVQEAHILIGHILCDLVEGGDLE
ncbi:SIS domain-containing protein [Parasulfuritortus cantonensis]|uniref:Phosphoheptose isomerase n=1 Tax=Parasulfuritortus cantonensis TaxID=2528202 RepID=A0A4R1BEC2_9PROT|nr:SIS domain-containing protein [Parasulfuritortus cantonensis]TCJ15451.1 SIS domain-containing protein [Parasulfuritortus cantonensis]